MKIHFEYKTRFETNSLVTFCLQCGAHNFKRRDSCFKCSSPRHESEAGEEGSDEVCTYPTNSEFYKFCFACVHAHPFKTISNNVSNNRS